MLRLAQFTTLYPSRGYWTEYLRGWWATLGYRSLTGRSRRLTIGFVGEYACVTGNSGVFARPR